MKDEILRFDEAESDAALAPKDADALIDALRTKLLQEQYRRLREGKQTLLIVIAGIDGAGKGSAINLLSSWLDPRHVHTLAFSDLTHEQAMRPAMWRYWQALPPKGQTGLIFGSWYAALLNEAVRKKPRNIKIMLYSRLITRFEASLALDGVQVVKLWFHLSSEAQQKRISTLLSKPETAWRVSRADLKVRKKFGRLRAAADTTLRLTDREHAPWVIIPSADEHLRNVRLAQTVLCALEAPIPLSVKQDDPITPTMHTPAASLVGLNYGVSLAKDDYDKELTHWQGRLSQAVRSKAFATNSLVVVFEGPDASGKGGAIRRIAAALDVRQFDIHPISAPTAEELSRPYLWRFWMQLPRHGELAIFDRSWYGRVLVERIEKLISPATWRRAYDEINSFESQLAANGTVVIKFWMAVTKDEQLRRFREREESPFKAYKITDDDWRNRSKWNAYKAAAQAMLERTDTEHAPWHVIAANDKRYARIAVLKVLVNNLENTGKVSQFEEPTLTEQSNDLS